MQQPGKTQLAIEFYRAAQKLKASSNLRNQLERASSSIVLNLAEGNERFSQKDRKKFFIIALGSLRECQAIIELVSTNTEPVASLADCLGAHLYKLIQAT